MKKQATTDNDQTEHDEDLGWVERHPALTLLLALFVAVLLVVGAFFLLTTCILKPIVHFFALVIGLALIGS